MTIAVRDDVAEALAEGRPVVALESTVIAHGLPQPRNLETALAMEAAVEGEGAVPATIGVLDGEVKVGLTHEEIGRFAEAANVVKCSTAALATAIGSGRLGATTAAATLFVAERTGIRFMATGGVGGVHRGFEATLDVSADLHELARTAIAVVCSGAKIILDLPRTFEMLETLGVTLLGWRTDEFPAFYCRESGLPVTRVEDERTFASIFRAHRDLGRASALLVGNPPPPAVAMARAEVEAMLEPALIEARRLGIRGKDETPFLLAELARRSAGQSVDVNAALLVENARLAAKLAVAFAAECRQLHK